MSDEKIYALEDIEAETRAEMVCPSCFEKGLEPSPLAMDYDGRRKKIIHATQCSQCGSVDPDEVEKMLKSKSYGFGGLSISLSWLRNLLTSDAAKWSGGFATAILVFVLIPAVALGAVGGSGDGGQANPSDGTNVAFSQDGWNVELVDGEYVITDGERYLCHDGISDTVGDDCTYSDADTGEERLLAFLNDEEWQFDGTAPNISDSGERLSSINYLHGMIVDQDEEPYAGGEIVFADSGRTVEANSDGEYELNEHLEPGTYELYAYTDTASTIPFEIEVGENGRVSVVGSPDSALYVSNEDGTIAQNRLNFVATTQYDIGASGGVDVDVE